MTKFLFVALLLSCFVPDILSANSSFEFHDSQGRCWRCDPGASCVRCTYRSPRVIPDSWDRTCQKPSGAICNQWPTTKFPSRCRDHFYQCQAGGNSDRVTCAPPGTFFDMRAQACVPIGEVRTQACDNYLDVGEPCDGATLPPGETTTPGITTTTTPTITPTADPITQTTTPPGGGQTTAGPVTNAPCVCVPFWPCPCNPCWHMPCHRCGGCFPMMG